MGLFYAILTSVLLSMGYTTTVPYAKLEKAIEANDSKEIVELSKQKILLNILGSEGVYGHPQAVLVLKGFFTKHPGNSFDYTFKGKPTSEGAFAIGSYLSKGVKYRVTIHFKKLSDLYKVESFTIEK